MKKGVRITMRTCSAQTPTNALLCKTMGSRGAYTLTEVIVVIVIVSLIILLAGTNFYGLLVKNTFRGQIQEIVSTMQMAANSAAETGRRYEVIFDLDQQNYLLRQITTPDLAQILEEEIIAANDLSENCFISYVVFDDGDYTNQDRAKFRVGPSGWQYGGKIIFIDATERAYSIVVNRLNRSIMLRDGDVEILMPKSPEEVPF